MIDRAEQEDFSGQFSKHFTVDYEKLVFKINNFTDEYCTQ